MPVLETLPLSARTSQNTNSPSQQIKENPAIFEASDGTGGRGDDTGGSSIFNPKRPFLSRKTMLQVPLTPYLLTAKCRCWRLCLCLLELVRTQIHLANKSKKTLQYSRRALELLLGVVTILVGPAFLIQRGFSYNGTPCRRFDSFLAH
jgi:hypothetical protein